MELTDQVSWTSLLVLPLLVPAEGVEADDEEEGEDLRLRARCLSNSSFLSISLQIGNCASAETSTEDGGAEGSYSTVARSG